MEYLYFDDFVLGATTRTGSVTMTEADMIAFAKQFDPQLMHTDPIAAMEITGGLIASGWHTASISMRLMLDARSKPTPPGTLGLGVEQMKWRVQVRPGDVLDALIKVVALRDSASKPGFGIVTTEMATFNQRGQTVLELRTSAIFPKKNDEETTK
jgi:acyl dehydratase